MVNLNSHRRLFGDDDCHRPQKGTMTVDNEKIIMT